MSSSTYPLLMAPQLKIIDTHLFKEENLLTSSAVKTNPCKFLCEMDSSERDQIKEEIKKINDFCRLSFLDSAVLTTVTTITMGAAGIAGFMSAGPVGATGGLGGGWAAGLGMKIDLKTEKVIKIINDVNSDRITRMCAKIRRLSKQIEDLKRTDPKNEIERDQLDEAKGYLTSRLPGIVIFSGNEPRLIRSLTISTH